MAEAPKTPTPKELEEARKARLKIINGLINDVDKEIGQGALMLLGAKGSVAIDSIPTGAVGLDMAIGPGGIPRGRIIELYGPESSGKTTLTLSIMAEAQKRGYICAMVDAEHAMDPDYARKCGVNVDELLISQPEYGEQGIDIASTLAASKAVALIVVDSVAALTPKAEIEGTMEESGGQAAQARMMGKAMRKLSAVAAMTGTSIIFINQLREKPGVSYGSPEYTPGGKALKFFASVRLDIRRGEAIKEGETQIGNRPRVKVVKNKVAPPFRTATFDIIFGKGVDRESSILGSAEELGIVEKAGSWYAYDGQRIGQGADKAKQWLKDNVGSCDQIEAKVRAHYEAKPAEAPEAPAKPADKKDDKK